MKKIPFVILMVIELLAALLAAGMLFADLGAVIYLIAILVYAAVLAPFFVRLKKTAEEEKKKKIRRNILLIPLIPIGVAIAMMVIVIVSLFLYG
ncbi:MAG: hypothetical protein IKV57_09825 [Clostridia bacterium]|nr:hypothetical protein [Clostridia bacterium]